MARRETEEKKSGTTTKKVASGECSRSFNADKSSPANWENLIMQMILRIAPPSATHYIVFRGHKVLSVRTSIVETAGGHCFASCIVDQQIRRRFDYIRMRKQ